MKPQRTGIYCTPLFTEKNQYKRWKAEAYDTLKNNMTNRKYAKLMKFLHKKGLLTDTLADAITWYDLNDEDMVSRIPFFKPMNIECIDLTHDENELVDRFVEYAKTQCDCEISMTVRDTMVRFCEENKDMMASKTEFEFFHEMKKGMKSYIENDGNLAVCFDMYVDIEIGSGGHEE